MKKHLFSLLAATALALGFLACAGTDSPPEPPKPISVQSLQLEKSTLNMSVGDSTSLEYSILPENAANKNVSWYSTNASIVSVNYTGFVRAEAPGIATIIATSEDKGLVSSCRITVTPRHIPVTGITLDKDYYECEVGETIKVTATVLPADATNKTLIWWVGGTSVGQSIGDYAYTAGSPGLYRVYAQTAEGNFLDYCSVRVFPKPPVIIPDGTVRTLLKGSTRYTYNIVYLAEGYLENEGELFNKHIDDIVRVTFSTEPFKSYKEYFNVYSVFAHSRESASRLSPGIYLDSAFRSFYDLAVTSVVWFNEFDKAYRYAQKATLSPCSVGLIRNHMGGGGGALPTNPSRGGVGYFTAPYGGYTHLHELGHNFRLGDEYGPYTEYWIFNPSTFGDGYNGDYVGNPNSVRWKHFIGRVGYLGVGVFEGCNRAYNLYRPTNNSIMNSPSAGYFNAPSREGIVKELFKVVGETYTLQKFLEKDVPNGY